MKNLKKLALKKISAVILSVALVLSLFSISAFAEEPALVSTPQVATSASETPVTRQSVGNILTSCGGSISGGYGELTCYLGSGNWWADINAGVSSSNSSGAVSCYVDTPDGNSYYLGSLDASGGSTNYMEFTYCDPGTYTFRFEAGTYDEIYVYGRIYD